MKKIFRNIFLAAALLGASSSCSLDEDPYGFLSKETFYQTPEDAESALTYSYAIMSQIEYYSRHYIIATEVPSESLTIKPDAGADQHALDRLNINNTNGIAEDMWRYPYIGINRANAVIENVKDISGLSKTREAEIVAEAKFLRALHHFNLVRFFGDVVIRDVQVDSKSGVPKGLSPMSDVYTFIEEDLLAAEEVLSTDRNYGRGNKVATWALLAKMYLHIASSAHTGVEGYNWVTSSQEYYTKAATYAGKVLHEQSTYMFEDDLLNTWNVDARYDAKEHIFVSATDRSGLVEGEYSKLPIMFTPNAEGASQIILPNGVTIRGGGFEHFWIEDSFRSTFESGDKRNEEMIFSSITVPASGDDEEDKELYYPGGGLMAAFPIKFLDPNQEGEQTSCDTPILRYTDIMMVYAEAVGATGEAYAIMDQIRSRAGLAPLPAGMSDDDFRTAILKERSYELAFEGQRLFDLRRTNSMESVLGGEHGKTLEKGVYYFEIPQTEIDSNPMIP
ncbi:RagB/SusD family nutrient uptake outer membrane protein [Sediminitomix flava]|uniref:Putative outer membrane starch-binding protein n=1 Tax=Sediminitomix flava TaxID=379075 RepID=A0A315ZDH0_SEDFL|nr:RagB/SusD family nutrient uptake outer membrane protein [Sediminitomix flava]PWJ43163.1 putative outer membrane starch-binding protein [Sediminitomix flava]